MSFIYNAHRLLKAVRSDEVKNPEFKFTDQHGRQLTHQGELINLHDIKRMHDEELERYCDFVQRELFFGENIPEDIFPKFEIENIVDSVNNSSVGYCFLDDSRNGFDKFRHSYGHWLLSDPKRAEKFVYHHNGELLWKPDAVFGLLNKLQASREILAPGVAYSSLLQVRATEFARILLRNTTGAMRNLRMEYHILNYIATSDKTSHQHLKDRYIPHAITRPWSMQLVRHLVLFRPFEEFVVGKFMDEDALHRYRTQMWPELKGTLTADKYGDCCGAITKRYLKLPFKPQRWRSLMTAFSSYLPNSRAFDTHKEYFVDMAMMHGSGMRNRYGRAEDQAIESDFRVTVGCIRACLDFQKHVGVGQERPFTLGTAHDDASETVEHKGGWCLGY
jgi:hypothetical protein